MRVAVCFAGLVGGINGQGGKGGANQHLIEIGYINHCARLFNRNPNVKFDNFIFCWEPQHQEILCELYQPALAEFVPQKTFYVPKTQYNRNAFLRGKSKWYSTLKVTELRRAYEQANNVKYDLVIFSRFDVLYSFDFILSEYDPDKIYVGDMLSHKHMKNTGYPCEKRLMDIWMISKPDHLDCVSQLYKNLPNLVRCKRCYWQPSRNQPPQFCNHRVLYEQILHCGLFPNLVVSKYAFRFHFHLIRHWFSFDGSDVHLHCDASNNKPITFI